LQEIKHKYGADSIMLTGSARGPGNEANYVMQKFARAAIGTNNIDHCARV
jgi:formate dehydrogenase major subunit